MRAISASILFFLLLVAPTSSTWAQDYRIYTRVFQIHPDAQPEIVARTLTLWHAGKAYDWSDEIGELAVYDPAARRYTLVSGRNQKACTVEFSELRNFMKVARVKAQDYLEDISESDQPGTAAVINSTRFQLDPMFEITHEGPDVKFDSEHMSYQIKTVPAPNEDLAETFAEYADWACQLNFLLHGQSLFPNPRMAVNQTLREQKLLPIQVELQILQTPKVHLQAEHSIQWNLSVQDRERIHDWQTMLESGKLEFLSFQNYQMKQLERQ